MDDQAIKNLTKGVNIFTKQLVFVPNMKMSSSAAATNQRCSMKVIFNPAAVTAMLRMDSDKKWTGDQSGDGPMDGESELQIFPDIIEFNPCNSQNLKTVPHISYLRAFLLRAWTAWNGPAKDQDSSLNCSSETPIRRRVRSLSVFQGSCASLPKLLSSEESGLHVLMYAKILACNIMADPEKKNLLHDGTWPQSLLGKNWFTQADIDGMRRQMPDVLQKLSEQWISGNYPDGTPATISLAAQSQLEHIIHCYFVGKNRTETTLRMVRSSPLAPCNQFFFYDGGIFCTDKNIPCESDWRENICHRTKMCRWTEDPGKQML
jgi:hypothetical protein